MRKVFDAPEMRVKKFSAVVLLDLSTNAARVEEQAKSNYANVQMTKVDIRWQDK